MRFKEWAFSDLLVNIVDNRGKTCPVVEKGMPLIATNCIKQEYLYPVFEKIRYVKEDTYLNWFREHPLPGDIIFVCKGTPGRVALVPDPVPFCIAQDMVAIRADENKIVSKYLFALLRSQEVQNKIANMHVGTLIPHFKKGDFKNLYLTIPEDIDYQRTVGEIYFNFSNKIHINTQINQNLEQIAQAIFKSWFVDFDPVKAKMAVLESGGTKEETERAAMAVISGKDDDALNRFKKEQPKAYAELEQTASLFPSSMQDSELGEIPEGWYISKIGDEVTVVGGGTPSTKKNEFWVEGDVHWTTPKDLSNISDKLLIDTERKITKAGLNKISSGLLPINTVLMSSRAPVGYLAIAKIPLAVNQGYIAMKCDKKLPYGYVVQWCTHNMEDIKQRASGTTFAEISKNNFRPMKVIVSSEEVLIAYSDQINSLYNKVECGIRENRLLESLRDTLLPKLLSGEIDVSTLPEVSE